MEDPQAEIAALKLAVKKPDNLQDDLQDDVENLNAAMVKQQQEEVRERLPVTRRDRKSVV